MYSGVTQRWTACTVTQQRNWSNRVCGAELAAQSEHRNLDSPPCHWAAQGLCLWVKTSVIRNSPDPYTLNTLLVASAAQNIWWPLRNLQNTVPSTWGKKGDEIVENFPASPVFENSVLCPVTESEFNKYKAVINYLSQSPLFLQHKTTCYFATCLLPKCRNNSASHRRLQILKIHTMGAQPPYSTHLKMHIKRYTTPAHCWWDLCPKGKPFGIHRPSSMSWELSSEAVQ